MGDVEMLGSPLTGPPCQAQDPCPCCPHSPPSSLLLAMKMLERRLSTETSHIAEHLHQDRSLHPQTPAWQAVPRLAL